MRLSSRARPITFGLTLAVGMMLTIPNFDFGVAHSSGSSGRSRASRMQRERFVSHPSHRLEFFDVGGHGEQPVIVIQQSPSPAIVEPKEPTNNRIYVPPRWVDGGYGVQILRPGYWITPKQAAEY